MTLDGCLREYAEQRLQETRLFESEYFDGFVIFGRGVLALGPVLDPFS
jgi:hypothetical protein